MRETQKSRKEAERQEAIDRLRQVLKPGDRVYGIVRTVSRSGMSRTIDFYTFKPHQEERDFGYQCGDIDRFYLSGWIATARDSLRASDPITSCIRKGEPMKLSNPFQKSKSGRAAKKVLAKRRGYIEQAATERLPECPKCGAAKGDACRTPSDRTTRPHAGRGLGTLSQLYLVGREIRNLEPEMDCYDPDDEIGARYDSGNKFDDGSPTFERITPPGSRGVIVEYREAEDAADVVFYETGAWIILTREEALSGPDALPPFLLFVVAIVVVCITVALALVVGRKGEPS